MASCLSSDSAVNFPGALAKGFGAADSPADSPLSVLALAASLCRVDEGLEAELCPLAQRWPFLALLERTRWPPMMDWKEIMYNAYQ